MADDQDFGPAQPIADVVKGAYKKMNDVAGMINKYVPGTVDKPTPLSTPPKPDTSWHDEMVKKAQQSFATQTKAQKRPPVAAKVQVKSSVKSSPTKQTGGK